MFARSSRDEAEQNKADPPGCEMERERGESIPLVVVERLSHPLDWLIHHRQSQVSEVLAKAFISHNVRRRLTFAYMG